MNLRRVLVRRWLAHADDAEFVVVIDARYDQSAIRYERAHWIRVGPCSRTLYRLPCSRRARAANLRGLVERLAAHTVKTDVMPRDHASARQYTGTASRGTSWVTTVAPSCTYPVHTSTHRPWGRYVDQVVAPARVTG